ncbi:hypothetical protein SAZ_16285 [Streptomyces noursei ZPM]|nr:hypothetical protein SAZ_16285 [Streptomyces noursei ZPM]
MAITMAERELGLPAGALAPPVDDAPDAPEDTEDTEDTDDASAAATEA